MSNVEDWFMLKLNSLNNLESNNQDTLIELKTTLLALTQDYLRCIAQKNLLPIFACISEEQLDESELSADILLIILPQLLPITVLNGYGAEIQRSLAHSSCRVKRTLINCLLASCATVDCLALLVAEQSGILMQLVECLTCSDRSVAEGSVQYFKKLGTLVRGPQIMFNDVFCTILKSAMQVNDVTRFRIYEIAVEVALSTDDGLQAAHHAGLLPAMLAELKSNDPLLQLNALELATNLASNKTGFMYLQRAGVVTFLVQLVAEIQNNALSFILLPGLIEFFGNLCMREPAVFSQQHPEALQLLLDSFETMDPALLAVVISTIGKIGSSDEGKRVLILQEHKLISIITKLGELIQRKNSLSAIVMDSLGALLATNDDGLSQTTIKWFQYLGSEAPVNIVSSCKLPFQEIRISALKLLRTLSELSWGAHIIVNIPGLLEFLLDRNVEFDKDCKVTKHGIVKGLLFNATSEIPEDVQLHLKQHVTEGPFYVAIQPQTAVNPI